MPVEFLNASAVLLQLTEDETTTQTGDSMAVSQQSGNDEGNFVALFNVTQEGTGSIAGVVQSSWDGGTIWYDVATMTPLAAAGNRNQVVDVENIGPLVRAQLTPGSSAGIDAVSSVTLAWSGAFRVQ